MKILMIGAHPDDNDFRSGGHYKVSDDEIREYEPDIIFTHRNNNYHADHRIVALLVQDASYLLGVPNFCPETKAIKTPVIMYFYDGFTNPTFEADIVIPIDDVIDEIRKRRKETKRATSIAGFEGICADNSSNENQTNEIIRIYYVIL